MSPEQTGVTLKAHLVAILDVSSRQWRDAMRLARSCPGTAIELAHGRLELVTEPDGRVLLSSADLTVEVQP